MSATMERWLSELGTITLDTSRTVPNIPSFPQEKYGHDKDAVQGLLTPLDRQAQLHNLLLAYSISTKSRSHVGYAQGMTYLGALLLQYMKEEVR